MKLVSKKSIKNFLIDKNGYELGPSTLLLLVILFAGGTAVMLVMMGKWLDLTGYRYKMETQRNAMNLIQLIVSNSPVVKEVTDQPDKLILDAKKLDDYESDASIGTETPSDRRKGWENYTDFLDFDHNFTVHDLVTGKNWTIGNLVFKDMSDCYPRRIRGFADLPVVVSQDGDNHPAVATVRLMRTPLSDLSFWLSQAFIRAYWDDYWNLFPEEDEYTVNIPLDPEIKRVSIDVNQKRICTHLDNIVICKNFIFKDKTSSGNPIVWSPDDGLTHTGDCMNVVITVTKNREVIILYPG